MADLPVRSVALACATVALAAGVTAAPAAGAKLVFETSRTSSVNVRITASLSSDGSFRVSRFSASASAFQSCGWMATAGIESTGGTATSFSTNGTSFSGTATFPPSPPRESSSMSFEGRLTKVRGERHVKGTFSVVATGVDEDTGERETCRFGPYTYDAAPPDRIGPRISDVRLDDDTPRAGREFTLRYTFSEAGFLNATLTRVSPRCGPSVQGRCSERIFAQPRRGANRLRMGRTEGLPPFAPGTYELVLTGSDGNGNPMRPRSVRLRFRIVR